MNNFVNMDGDGEGKLNPYTSLHFYYELCDWVESYEPYFMSQMFVSITVGFKITVYYNIITMPISRSTNTNWR